MFRREYSLRVIAPDGIATTRKLEPLPFTIGRSPDSHLVLRDNRISRQHVRLSLEGDCIVVEDLESRHGLRLNGVKKAKAALKSGDTVDFGVDGFYQIQIVEEQPAFLGGPGAFRKPGFGGFAGARPTATEPMSKLRALLEVTRAMHGSLGVEDVLAAILDAALEITGLERGALLLRGPQGLRVKVSRSRGRIDEPDLASITLQQLQKALDARPDLWVLDPDLTIPGLPQAAGRLLVPLVQFSSHAVDQTAALTTEQATAGLIYLDADDIKPDLSSGGRELLQTLALEASQVLSNAYLMEEAREKQVLERELDLARTIQKNLLPRELPDSGWLKAAGGGLPSALVSGDFYDLVEIDENSWLFALADVSGKGVSSALLAAMLQGSLVAFSRGHVDRLEEAMAELSLFLYQRAKGEKYATVFIGVIHRDGRVNYVNAAHPAGYVLRANGELIELAATGTPVGLLKRGRFQQAEVQLAAGDKLLLLSDGLTEARNPAGFHFDEGALSTALDDLRKLSASDGLDMLFQRVADFSASTLRADDATALLLEFETRA